MWWLVLVMQRWNLQHLVYSRKYAELMDSGPTDKVNNTFLPTTCLLHQPCLPMSSQPKVLTATEDYLMVTTANICVNKMGNIGTYAGGGSTINSRQRKDLSTGLQSMTSTQKQQLQFTNIRRNLQTWNIINASPQNQNANPAYDHLSYTIRQFVNKVCCTITSTFS